MTKASWQRPTLPTLDAAKDRLVFQQVSSIWHLPHQHLFRIWFSNLSWIIFSCYQYFQVELDHYIGRPVSGMPGASSGPVPVVRMYGVTKWVSDEQKQGPLLGKASMKKKSFLSGIARMREGAVYPCPNFLALFQKVHFWSIKRVYFFKNANVLKF